MKSLYLNLLILFTLSFLAGCKLADLQTQPLKEEGLTAEHIMRGKALLENAWRKQGMDKLANHSTYMLKAEDHWRGALGRFGKAWPTARASVELKYVIGTFDSQVTFLDGKKSGLTAGLQSWHYYESEPGTPALFQETPDKKIRFGLSAFQYFFELTDRLRRAPIISYAGEKEHKGRHYDLVFATWDTIDPNKQYDQYLLWISKDSGLVEYAEFTIRDTYLRGPGVKAFYGSILFDDLREIDGVLIPFEQYIFLNSPKKKEQKYLHKLTVSEFTFDAFDMHELRIDPALTPIGDDKVKGD